MKPLKSLVNLPLLKSLMLFATITIPLSPGFKLAAILFIILTFILKLQLNHLFLAAFIVTILTLQFYSPNKSYTLTTIQYQNFKLGFKLDYLQAFGLHLTNLFLLLTLFTLYKQNLAIFSSRYVQLVVCSLLLSVLMVIAGSTSHSPFPELSATWAIQYSEIYIIALLTCHLLTRFPKGSQYLNTVLVATMIIQLILVVFQFIGQTPLGTSFENGQGNYFAGGLDENNALYRVEGTFAYANQLAIIMITLFNLISWFSTRKTMTLTLTLWVITGVVVALTQSRSGMLALFISTLWFYFKNKIIITSSVQSLGPKRLTIYTILIILALSPILIPRILLSFNAFEVGAGIPVREKMIIESLTLINESPWFGFGPGTNEYLLFANAPDKAGTAFLASVHNGFISLVLEIGLLGLIISLLPFIFIFRHLVNTRNLPHDPQIKAYRNIFITGLASWVIYYIFQPHSGIIEFPYIGILLGYGLTSTFPKSLAITQI